MELNQKKLADKVEANHNHVFEYVDKKLNTMWNELSEQVENNISDDNEGQSFNKQAFLSSIQMPSDNIIKTEVIRIVKDELRKINKANDLNNVLLIYRENWQKRLSPDNPEKDMSLKEIIT